MATTVYDALDRLVTIFTAAIPATEGLEEVAVIDGGMKEDSPTTALCVGYSAGEGIAADGAQRRQEGLSLTRRREEYDLTATIYVTDGDGDMAEARATNKAIYNAVEAALAANPQLATSSNPLVDSAVMGFRFILHEEQTRGGAEVVARFTIHVETLIQ